MTLALDTPALTSSQPRYRPEDILRLENEGLYELVDGQLVEKTMSVAANKTSGLLTTELNLYFRGTDRPGDVIPEQTFRCFAFDSDMIRRPDVAVILPDRVPPGGFTDGHVTVVPDLVIEVVSPHDLSYELEDKLDDYRKAGVPMVWVVYPHARIVRIHRPDHTVTELTDEGVLTGENVLPGLSIPIMNILPRK